MQRTGPSPTHLPRGGGETLEALGNTIEIKADRESTGGAFTLIDYVMRGDVGPPAHYHAETDEAFFVLEGSFEVEVDDRRCTANAGDYVFVPRGSVHRARRLGGEPGRILMLFVPAGFEGYFRELVAMVQQDPTWPPTDMDRMSEVGRKYDQHLPVDDATA